MHSPVPRSGNLAHLEPRMSECVAHNAGRNSARTSDEVELSATLHIDEPLLHVECGFGSKYLV